MQNIDLTDVDLNLLVTFDVVMAEGNVTRAAARLGRTQSAVSHALKRLREQLGDPLIAKRDGHMRPSPFALILLDEVRPILRSIQRAIAPQEPFDPATSKRIFRIAVPAFTALLSAVSERVHTAAPGVSLEWMLPDTHVPVAVAEGRIDIAHIGGDALLPDGVTVCAAQPFTWVTFGRANHPALSNWGLHTWTAWPHVIVSIGNDTKNPTDEAMTGLGLARTIGARIPAFSGVAPLLAGTNMLGTFPPLAMADDMLVYGLRALKPPVPLPPFGSRFYWSSRLAHDAANRWIRDIVLDVYTRLQESAEDRLAHTRLVMPRSVLRDPPLPATRRRAKPRV